MLLNTTQSIITFIEAIGTGGVLAILLGSTGIGGVITGVIAWKKAPVERRDADLAIAERSQTMSLGLAAELRTELTRMGERIANLETKLTEETRQRQHLERDVRDQRDVNYRLRVVLSRMEEAWKYIVANWDTVRLQHAPPVFPAFEEVP